MGKDPGEGGATVGDGRAETQGSRGPDEIRAEIQETREELGQTVAKLAEKTGLKQGAKRRTAKAKERVVTSADGARRKAWEAIPPPARERARTAAGTARAKPVPTAAIVIAVLVLVLVLRRR